MLRKGVSLVIAAVFSISAAYSQCGIDLGPDTTYCPTAGINLTYDFNADLRDSLQIQYISTFGVSSIISPEKVYMHSSYEVCSFCGAVPPWVGNWGLDDGIGEMTLISPNTYQITIEPYSYYGFDPANMHGLFMVFRSADGLRTGKNDTDQDIWVNMGTDPPTSAFNGVGFNWIASKYDSLVWNDGTRGGDFTITGPGTYSVIAYGAGGCIDYDTIVVAGTDFSVLDLGNDTTICSGTSLNLDALAGWDSISWSDGSNGQFLNVDTSGLFVAQVFDAGGCSKADSITIGLAPLVTAAFDTSITEFTVNITDNSVDATSYSWDYNNDGIADSTIASSHSYTYSSAGPYTIKLIASNSCGVDSATKDINISGPAGPGPCNLSLGNDTAVCDLNLANLSYDFSGQFHPDLMNVIYDATQGTSGLSGASKVYMHSSDEACGLCGPTLPWVGNWGMDDGIGEMTSAGTNLWEITIDPVSYYGVNSLTEINGIFMVFRNEDGSAEGKDDTNQDIWVNTGTNPPSSAFGGLTMSWIESEFDSIIWNDTLVSAQYDITTAGMHTVKVVGSNGCILHDTINVTEADFTALNLGSDTAICDGANLTLDAGLGWAGQTWTGGSTGTTLMIDSANTYSVTVDNGAGCNKTDSIVVSILPIPNAMFTSLVNGTVVSITDNSVNSTTYAWDYQNDGSNDANTVGSHSFTYDSAGDYTILLEVNNNCGMDTMTQMITIEPLFTGTPCQIELGNDTAFCSGGNFNLNYDFSEVLFEDSLIIIYDASKGTSGLGGAGSVYLHSTYQTCGACVPATPWVGNWGLDDGLGQLTNIGTDLWKIVLSPEDYYSISMNNIHSLVMVFRNPDGSETGKDNLDQDIVLDLSGAEPVSTFDGITSYWSRSANDSIIWNNAFSSPTYSISTNGTYTVQVIGNDGCVQHDTIIVTENGIPLVDIGNDQGICDGNTLTLDAGAGWSSYLWSDGSTAQTLEVSTTGTYQITVTDNIGCEGFDVINVGTADSPIASFTSENDGNTVNITDNSQGTGTYYWDFDSDGIIDDTTEGDVSHRYELAGTYSVTLKIENECGVDSVIKLVQVIGNVQDEHKSEFTLYPNPSSGIVQINTTMATYELKVYNTLGELVIDRNTVKSIDLGEHENGVYYLVISDDKGTRVTKKLILFKK